MNNIKDFNPDGNLHRDLAKHYAKSDIDKQIQDRYNDIYLELIDEYTIDGVLTKTECEIDDKAWELAQKILDI